MDATTHPEDPRTFAIIGAAMEVHRELGPGFLEALYHEALIIELAARGITARSEVPFQVRYKGKPLGHMYRADLVCDNGVLVEIKAHSGFGEADEAQIIHYLRASGISTGLLLNFGRPSLQQRRFVFGMRWKTQLGEIGAIGGSSSESALTNPGPA